MAENQQNNALMALRQEIDKIDNQIISLLTARMEIISKVGDLKKNNNEKFFIRSNREADMIKTLVEKSNGAFPKSTIIDIWRKIITAANMYEQRLHIAIHNPKNISDYAYLVREYYSNLVPISNFDSATNLVAAMEKGEAQIGIFVLPKDDSDNLGENWWIGLANNHAGLKVFAKIPFLEISDIDKKYSPVQLVAVASKEAEKSSSDNSLFCVELSTEFSKSSLISTLKNHGINARILKSAKLPQVDTITFYLLDVDGFF